MVSDQSFTVGMMSVVRRPHELAQTLIICTPASSILPKPLTSSTGNYCCGLSSKSTSTFHPRCFAVIRLFHDGTRARVRMDDGTCSDRFNAGQGPRQGRNLATLLFHAFSAAKLMIAFDLFFAATLMTACDYCRQDGGDGGHGQGQEDGDGREAEERQAGGGSEFQLGYMFFRRRRWFRLSIAGKPRECHVDRRALPGRFGLLVSKPKTSIMCMLAIEG